MKWVQCPTAQGAAARTGRPQTALQRLQSLNQGRSLCPALSFPRTVSGVKCLMFQQTVSSVQCSIFSVSSMLVSGVSWPVQTENATRPRGKSVPWAAAGSAEPPQGWNTRRANWRNWATSGLRNYCSHGLLLLGWTRRCKPVCVDWCVPTGCHLYTTVMPEVLKASQPELLQYLRCDTFAGSPLQRWCTGHCTIQPSFYPRSAVQCRNGAVYIC